MKNTSIKKKLAAAAGTANALRVARHLIVTARSNAARLRLMLSTVRMNSEQFSTGHRINWGIPGKTYTKKQVIAYYSSDGFKKPVKTKKGK